MEHEVCHHLQFAFGQAVSEGRHAVAAVGDLVVDLGLGLELEFALAKAGDLCTVGEDLSFRFGPMADRALLAENRRLIGLAVGYYIMLGL